MTLNLLLEPTGKSWTLRPNREYVVGAGRDCDIPLPDNNVVSEHHVKFSYDQMSRTWHVCDLGSGRGTYVNNQAIGDYLIQSQTRISVAGSLVLVATPETDIVPQPPMYTPAQQNVTAPPVAPVAHQAVTYSQQTVAANIERLDWNQYVERQVEKQRNWLARVATNFHLSTGLRNHPWIRFNDQGNDLGFGFDGYIIPNFLNKGNVQEVEQSILNNISVLRNYKDTDCYVVELADEHLINSAKETILQQLLSVRFFPIRRGGNGDLDYRKFLVVSYNQIRTYLIVEGYGTDLFVSWITRYEPNITPGIVYWLVTAAAFSFLLLFTNNLIIASAPLFIWGIIYLLLPQLMKYLKILPKKANAHLFIFILIYNYFASLIYGLSSLQATSQDALASLGVFVGTLFVMAIIFLIGVILNLIYIGIITAAIWAMEKATANTSLQQGRY